MTKPRSWTRSQTAVLIDMVTKQMKDDGFADFSKIAPHVGRNPKSCNQRAYSLGVPFQTKQRNVPEITPRPKRDMVNLPLHKNGKKVNYGGVV